MPLRGVGQQAVLRQQPPAHRVPRRRDGDQAAARALTVDDVDQLYDLPVDEFIAARDRLVKARRSAGDRAGATEVKALRKPTRASWALNQVARHSPDVIAAVIAAGAELQDAQAAALDGDATGLRPAMEAERTAVESAVEAAQHMLEVAGLGLGGAVLEKVRRSLRAAVSDAGARDQLQGGRLTDDLEPQGFGADDAFAVAGVKSKRTQRPPDADEREKALARARAEAQRLRDEARVATARAEKLASAAAAAEREAAERRGQADRALADAEAAQAAASEAADCVAEVESDA